MNGDPKLYQLLDNLNINYQYIAHPPAPTIEIAKQFWKGHDAKHCKNLFFRNHKGNKHFLVILDCDKDMDIHSIEKQLGQGKLSFASEKRLQQYLGLTPGSVTPFGLINDTTKHVHLFIDENLRFTEKLSFHPCINTASLFIATSDFVRFLEHCGNTYEWIKLY
ncbi:MAG TPA: prolyl-tRNA synthetase associated domain-containing protein [Bacteroidales bacterium]|jgi:Ala-tRNA(Pro) deacylase|nr:prolyl-tRNA synthetase associated domain-containing protein [Bacteroidales bacterium]HOF15645.1 prolyl-tRNA synthetase associated domain-containing protein [Bacteroidales bacterium]HON19908.1 prolyl-tRNA synthetase associated domain-containing protein [Bacteroidales bacterium]HOR81490.1 prolyl-tRNA synthetase associated domain-containing protein [Bacteroidales bacterium]HPJ90665.1 prolyl-tRNA synthetase associated domain-containing protein [Bacteroidales bacterium]